MGRYNRPEFKQMVARLRNEGNALVLSIPVRIRETLCLKAGDMVMVRTWKGNMVTRKVDLSKVGVKMPKDDSEGVNESWFQRNQKPQA